MTLTITQMTWESGNCNISIPVLVTTGDMYYTTKEQTEQY